MKKKIVILVIMVVALALWIKLPVAQAAPPSGAIFTTTPDGAIVNENVRYESKLEVYLDGGPGPNAPQDAAGLDDGWYIFQVTDPSGWVLLSMDPAKCRVVEVLDGVIVRLVNPTEFGLSDGYTDQKGNDIPACHIQDDPDGVAGASGRHDTNTDVDHGPPAIVVQLMPFLDTPNPGGVYKAWMIGFDDYDENGGDLEEVIGDKMNEVVKKKGVFQGYEEDPGFGPPRNDSKTDNFKVKEVPPYLKVLKYIDTNGNGVFDVGEPEYEGWKVWITETLYDGTEVVTECYTPCSKALAPGSTVSVEEEVKSGWIFTYVYLDEVKPATQGPEIDVTFGPGEMLHTVAFGNFEKGKVTACKYEDFDGDGGKDVPIEGWTVYLTIDDLRVDEQVTGADGCYTWEDLGPLPAGSYYDAEEDDPAPEWTATSPLSVDFESPPQSGFAYHADFTNFENVDVTACKYEDYEGDGGKDAPIEGWTVYLTIDDVREDSKLTGEDGCYTWENLGPLPAGSYYDVEEDDPAPEWTATSPLSVDFESPPQSGASYRGDFTNFENVDVTACKVKDMDGSLLTTDDQSFVAGWPVYLTIEGVRQEPTQYTGLDGCYTWENLGPLPEGYYDVGEDSQEGWVALTETEHDFATPPISGASYSFTFINSPTQGCTPGFWQGGSAGGQAGGRWLWDTNGMFTDTISDPDWMASGGMGANPYNHTDSFCDYFGCDGNAPGENMWYYVNPDLWPNASDDFDKAARSLTAAYLNASWGMAYAYSTSELIDMWNTALSSGDFASVHGLLDAANNAPIGGCPIDASGF